MPSTEEAQQSQARRPTATRHHSTSSQVSQSPGSLSTSHRHKATKHVVGHGRQAGRNPSFGKNLNKLTKLAPANDVSSTPTARHHTRNKSGDSNGSHTATSPRPNIKRNASAFVVPRNTSHHSALKKNHSSGHLPRHGSSKNIMKQARHQAPPTKRTRSNRSDRSEPSPPHPTVRFALGEDVGYEDQHEGDDWTEESASASPHTTRSSTPARQSSIVAEGSMATKAEEVDEGRKAQSETWKLSARAPPSPRTQQLPDRSVTVRDINGSSSYVPTGALDADDITSRLLQRVPSSNAVPKVSAVNATVTAERSDIRSLSHSQGSTMPDGTPGRDLVSRFIQPSSSRGTPGSANFLPLTTEQPCDQGRQSELHRRNRSTPNFADAQRDSPTPQHSRAHSQRSSSNVVSAELPPSRTQKKLLLQRASSNLDPQKHIPAVLPRAGASQLMGHGVSFSSNEHGLPMQIRSLFEQTTKEYQVVRRYKNPVADAIARLSEIPGAPRQRSIPKPKGKGHVNGDGRHGLSQSYKNREEHNLRESREHHGHQNGINSLRRGTLGHKARVSFDLPGRPTPQDEEAEEQDVSYPNSDNGRIRDEAYEICRRLWEIGEVADAG